MFLESLSCRAIELQAPLAGLVTEVMGVSSNPGLRSDLHGVRDGGEGRLGDHRIERYRPVWLNQPALNGSQRLALVARRDTRSAHTGSVFPTASGWPGCPYQSAQKEQCRAVMPQLISTASKRQHRTPDGQWIVAAGSAI